MICRFCGHEIDEPELLHLVHCDGRQGRVEDAHYPDTPGYQDTDTSYDAAQAMHAKAASMRALIYVQLGDAPLTADETAQRLQRNKYTIRARFAELHTKGLIADTGERRENVSGHKAIVWSRAS
jgi:hypothetical protein